MKIIIAGGRDFVDYITLYKFCEDIIGETDNVEIVSGGAKGTDKLGERYAMAKGYGLKIFKANWKEFGKAAGIIRNREMAKYADRLIVFWDGESKGTKNIIRECKKRNLSSSVYNYSK